MTLNQRISDIVAGSEVFGSDNEKIGNVADIGHNYLLVQKGFLFVKDLYLPMHTVARVDGERVYLNLPKHEAERMATEELPAEGDSWYDTSGDSSLVADETGIAGPARYGTADDALAADRIVTEETPGRTNRASARRPENTARGGGELTVPVVEEELRAGVRDVETGRARIVKDVREEEQSIDVPVQHEEVYVTQQAANRPASAEDLTMMDRDIEIPLRQQEVIVTREAVVTGEVVVHKETVSETQRVSDTVRRERVHVEEPNNPRIHIEGFDEDRREPFDGMGDGDRARYTRFTEAERTQYDAMTPEQQRTYAADYDQRNPIRKVVDRIEGRP